MARHDFEDKARRGPPEDKAIAASRQRWICPRCGEGNPPSQDKCRNCGLKRPQKPAPKEG